MEEPSEALLDGHFRLQLLKYNESFTETACACDRVIVKNWLRIFEGAERAQKFARNGLMLLMYGQLTELGHLQKPFTDMRNCGRDLNLLLDNYSGLPRRETNADESELVSKRSSVVVLPSTSSAVLAKDEEHDDPKLSFHSRPFETERKKSQPDVKQTKPDSELRGTATKDDQLSDCSKANLKGVPKTVSDDAVASDCSPALPALRRTATYTRLPNNETEGRWCKYWAALRPIEEESEQSDIEPSSSCASIVTVVKRPPQNADDSFDSHRCYKDKFNTAKENRKQAQTGSEEINVGSTVEVRKEEIPKSKPRLPLRSIIAMRESSKSAARLIKSQTSTRKVTRLCTNNFSISVRSMTDISNRSNHVCMDIKRNIVTIEERRVTDAVGDIVVTIRSGTQVAQNRDAIKSSKEKICESDAIIAQDPIREEVERAENIGGTSESRNSCENNIASVTKSLSKAEVVLSNVEEKSSGALDDAAAGTSSKVLRLEQDLDNPQHRKKAAESEPRNKIRAENMARKAAKEKPEPKEKLRAKCSLDKLKLDKELEELRQRNEELRQQCLVYYTMDGRLKAQRSKGNERKSPTGGFKIAAYRALRRVDHNMEEHWRWLELSRRTKLRLEKQLLRSYGWRRYHHVLQSGSPSSRALLMKQILRNRKELLQMRMLHLVRLKRLCVQLCVSKVRRLKELLRQLETMHGSLAKDLRGVIAEEEEKEEEEQPAPLQQQ